MAKCLVANWQFLLALATLVWGGFTFFSHRADDQRWRRTEFLFSQARALEEDPEVRQVLRILEHRDTVSIEAVLAADDSTPPGDYGSLMMAVDKTLNFFDRLAYAINTSKAISVKEAGLFGWYLDLIAESPALRTYCEAHGFDDVISLARQVSPYASDTLDAVARDGGASRGRSDTAH